MFQPKYGSENNKMWKVRYYIPTTVSIFIKNNFNPSKIGNPIWTLSASPANLIILKIENHAKEGNDSHSHHGYINKTYLGKGLYNLIFS